MCSFCGLAFALCACNGGGRGDFAIDASSGGLAVGIAQPEETMKPYLGAHVLYTIGTGDADQINRRRHDFLAFNRRDHGPRHAGEAGATGHVAHMGNDVREGDVFPATIVRIFHPETTTVNLQVLLDGNDTFWATSRVEGDGPGQWHWAPRPEREAGDRPHRELGTSDFKPDR